MSTPLTAPARLAPGDVVTVAADLEFASATEILRWSIANVPRFAVSSSFGADSAALLHLLAQVDPDVPVLFIDTGFHFPETLAYRRDLALRLGLTDVRDLRPQMTVAEQARELGAGLYLRDPNTCCALRKVAPLNDALADFDGWATGVRRTQTLSRAGTPVVGLVDKGGRSLLKVAPLARWSPARIEGYLDDNHLPRHPLGELGVFPSIGCAPCTRPIRPGDDPRAGRWAGTDKTECGIHLDPT